MNLLFKIFGGNYDDLWKALIRPNRDIYTKNDLGPMKFEINDKCYKRTDLELINKKSQKIMCSFWEPFDEERESPLLPCVIYLHGNSSSRCEAYQDISYLLNRNITVFSFDFCGCGQSDGDYISLGYYEKYDVHCVVEYLLKSKKVSKIGLWGRSMGAVTAIMYANEHGSLTPLNLPEDLVFPIFLSNAPFIKGAQRVNRCYSFRFWILFFKKINR
jgi:pimeloyl-ACP methyl ester carboxylesterase